MATDFRGSDRGQIVERLKDCAELMDGAQDGFALKRVTSELVTAYAKALRDAAALIGGTCGNCRFFRKAMERNIDVRPWTESADTCCHPSEAHPMHWQETRDTFGCNDWAAADPPPRQEP